MYGLTYGRVWNEWLVSKAENLCDIIQIGMLSNQRPLRVVHSVVKISDGNLHTPILLVIDLHMPVHPDWAIVLSTLQQRHIILCWSV